MKKYVLVFAVLVAASVIVTGFYGWLIATSLVPVTELPIWLRLSYLAVGWPEGVTVWALLLTLLAIAEQTSETRRSADISSRVMVSQFRPMLIVRKITMTKGTIIPTFGVEDARPWTVDFDIANVGQGKAYVLNHGFFLNKGDSEKMVPDAYAVVGGGESFELVPGEHHRMSIPMPETLVFMLRHLGDAGLAKGYQGTDLIEFFGMVQYADEQQVERNTSVCRRYDNANARFIKIDDPDREYVD